MKWPNRPPELNLHQLEERLIALRIPFMQIRELPRGGQYSLKGNVINVPPSKQRIWDPYGPQMGNYMGPILATHMGPMWVLQQGFIWDPSGHIHMGPIRAPYRISHINHPSHIMHID